MEETEHRTPPRPYLAPKDSESLQTEFNILQLAKKPEVVAPLENGEARRSAWEHTSLSGNNIVLGNCPTTDEMKSGFCECWVQGASVYLSVFHPHFDLKKKR